jgi:hypothetical protein
LLTSDSYMTAWLVYVIATVTGLLILNAWLRSGLSAVPRWTLLLALAALSLTPAPPEPGATTWAPAILVTGFDLLTLGADSAVRALRPILIMVSLVLAMGAIAYLAGRFTRRS